MRSKKRFLIVLINSFLLIPFSTHVLARPAQGCGIITGIWHYGEELGIGEESKLLKIYRRGKGIGAKAGTPVFEKDKIEAKAPEVEFEITWQPKKETKQQTGQVQQSNRSVFRASEDEPLIQLTIEKCRERTVLAYTGEIINILKAPMLFEVKTKAAIAGAAGTNFILKVTERQRTTKLIVTKGEAYLRNNFGEVIVGESEIGTAKKGSPPTKTRTDKNYISKEIEWVFDRTGLPQLYASEFRQWGVPIFSKEQGVKDTEILVGTTLALTGPIAQWAKEIPVGFQTYFNHINELGGVHGRKINSIIYDDSYDIAKAVKNTQKLILKDNVFCFFSSYGTPTNKAIIPIITDNKIPYFGPVSLYRELTRVFNPYIFFLYPDYYTQAQKIVAYSMKKGRIAIIHEDTSYGNEGLQGTKYVLEGKGLKLGMEMKIRRSQKDFINQITALKGKNPNTVILFTSDDQAGLIVKQALELSWKPQFIGPSRIATQDFLDISGEAGEGNIVLSIVPDPKTSQKAEVSKYRELLKKYFPNEKPSIPSLQGYTSAKVLVEALRRARKYLLKFLW